MLAVWPFVPSGTVDGVSSPAATKRSSDSSVAAASSGTTSPVLTPVSTDSASAGRAAAGAGAGAAAVRGSLRTRAALAPPLVLDDQQLSDRTDHKSPLSRTPVTPKSDPVPATPLSPSNAEAAAAFLAEDNLAELMVTDKVNPLAPFQHINITVCGGGNISLLPESKDKSASKFEMAEGTRRQSVLSISPKDRALLAVKFPDPGTLPFVRAAVNASGVDHLKGDSHVRLRVPTPLYGSDVKCSFQSVSPSISDDEFVQVTGVPELVNAAVIVFAPNCCWIRGPEDVSSSTLSLAANAILSQANDWLTLIRERATSANVPVYLVAQIDAGTGGPFERVVSRDRAADWAKSNDVQYFECDASHGVNRVIRRILWDCILSPNAVRPHTLSFHPSPQVQSTPFASTFFNEMYNTTANFVKLRALTNDHMGVAYAIDDGKAVRILHPNGTVTTASVSGNPANLSGVAVTA